jgi:hypothetical protein
MDLPKETDWERAMEKRWGSGTEKGLGLVKHSDSVMGFVTEKATGWEIPMDLLMETGSDWDSLMEIVMGTDLD